jgi:hypothetical protein
MNPKHLHTPVSAGTQRRRCPVCQQTVYSRAGIHPQCAMKQAEPPRPSAKTQAAAERKTAPGGGLTPARAEDRVTETTS